VYALAIDGVAYDGFVMARTSGSKACWDAAK